MTLYRKWGFVISRSKFLFKDTNMSYTVYDLYRDSYIKVKVTRLVNKNLFLSSNFFNGHE